MAPVANVVPAPARRSARSRVAGLAALGALAAFGVAAAIPGSGRAAEPAPALAQEYDLKAAFLFHFAQFVEWPDDAFADAGAPIAIGVLGRDPFGATLDALVAGETVRSRPLVVRRYRSSDEIGDCHILFIGATDAGEVERILRSLGRRSILTVGETADFAAEAGVIGFELAQRRLRLRINLAAAANARLTISSKLLRQATIVRGRK